MINTKHIFSEQNILVAVPTYNNAGTIAHVITDLRKYVDNILIVNDGSTDNTSDILAASSVEHISYTKNKGKGYAIRQAFKYALANDYKYVLTIDSDGQHFASDYTAYYSINEHQLIHSYWPNNAYQGHHDGQLTCYVKDYSLIHKYI